jgi:predicted nucleic acid-binding protein
VIDYEVQSAVRRRVLLGQLAPATAREALAAFGLLEITLHPAHAFAERMWDMRENISTYDAAYVALAEALGIPLMTGDHRLARTAGLYCDVAAG